MRDRSIGRMARVAALATVAALAGCVGDGDAILGRSAAPDPGGELFVRYVSLGNSITAGFQSGGLNDSLQVRAYPVMLAAMAGASFHAPSIAGPGCPQPMQMPLVQPPGAGACVRLTAPRFVNNLGVPGERLEHLLEAPTTGSAVGLHSLLIGPQAQLDVMDRIAPTLVTMWMGNNDALGAAITGSTAAMTPAAAFDAVAEQVFARLDAAAPVDVVVIGVVNPLVVPLLQPGAFYYFAWAGAVGQGQPSPWGRPVNANCAPGMPGASRPVSLAILGSDAAEISCAADAPFVVNEDEAVEITARVAAFNASLRERAEARGWAWVDSNMLIGQFLNDPNRIRKCQGLAALSPTATQQEVFIAIANTCPALQDPAIGFGSLFSLDGVHPSTEAHQIVAQTLAAVLGQRHGLALGAQAPN